MRTKTKTCHPIGRTTFVLTLATALASGTVTAGPVTVPTTFSGGTPAVAAEVNGNFAAVTDAVNDNDARVAQLEAENAALNDRILELETFIGDLRDVLSLENDNQGNPAVVFSGVNVHVNNGEGQTNTINALGNLIIGYDESVQEGEPVCSNGAFENEETCLAMGHVFALSHKSGSHTLIIGPRNNYSQYGGLVVGEESTVNGGLSTALGFGNNAGGFASTVTGGSSNTVTGKLSNVTGGTDNLASGTASSVGGGRDNMATGHFSSVSGGSANLASGFSVSVSGGNLNTAVGHTSSVSGGQSNIATGILSTVGGGNNREATGNLSWRAGNLEEAN